MKIKTLLVDDDIKNCKLMEHFLDTYSDEIEVVGKAHSIQQAITLLEDKTVELILLDVELENGEDGFQLLDKIDNMDKHVVFVTSFNEYAIKAFKYHAIDYILKPVVIEELLNSIEIVKIKIQKAQKQQNISELLRELKTESLTDQLAIPCLNKIEIFQKQNINYIRADRKYTQIIDIHEKATVSSRNIGEYEDILRNDRFIRIHNSTIINLNHLKTIEKNNGWICVIANNVRLEVSRRKQEELYEALNMRSVKHR